MRRQLKGVWVHHCIHDDRSIPIRQSFSESVLSIGGVFQTYPLGPHCLSHLGKVWIIESGTEGDKTAFLLFYIDEVERSIIKNDLNDRSSVFDLSQQITQREHREPAVSA